MLFGGVLQGIAISIALKSGASTAGTDFIALMVSNRTGKTIWQYVFVFNCTILAIFGVIFGWEHAAYSIIFQFLSTKTIDSFYHRYDRVTLQITTEHGDAVLKAYSRIFHHGSTRFKAQGGYSGKPVDFIVTVVSAYEADDIVRFVRHIDPHAVINVCKTENFVGNFHRAPADEPLPLEAEDTPQNDPVLEFIDTVRSNVEREASRPRRLLQRVGHGCLNHVARPLVFRRAPPVRRRRIRSVPRADSSHTRGEDGGRVSAVESAGQPRETRSGAARATPPYTLVPQADSNRRHPPRAVLYPLSYGASR